MKTEFIRHIQSVFVERRTLLTPTTAKLVKVTEEIDYEPFSRSRVYRAEARVGTQYSVLEGGNNGAPGDADRAVPFVIQKHLAEAVYSEVRHEIKQCYRDLAEVLVYLPEVGQSLRERLDAVLEMTDPR